mgnify:CR=1 FL=1
MMQTILAHYETGNGLEPINLFTVLYMLRKHQNATVRLLCDHHAGFVQAQDKDEKDQVRRAIANQIARAERQLNSIADRLTAALAPLIDRVAACVEQGGALPDIPRSGL